jgi:hypothetical protein
VQGDANSSGTFLVSKYGTCNSGLAKKKKSVFQIYKFIKRNKEK